MRKKKNRLLVVGVTGSLASGKTTVARMLQRLGAYCIDADKLYHQLIKPQGVVYRKIVSVFGREILNHQGQINRRRLAKSVFNKRQETIRLSQITHPAIIKQIKEILARLKRAKGYKVVVIDAPLLIEAGLIKMVDKLVVVKATQAQQLTRGSHVLRIFPQEVKRRIAAQMPLAQKVKLADVVIDNSRSLKVTRAQVRKFWEKIK